MFSILLCHCMKKKSIIMAIQCSTEWLYHVPMLLALYFESNFEELRVVDLFSLQILDNFHLFTEQASDGHSRKSTQTLCIPS